ncbi:esterase/lipase family protein [Jannaschia sp. KMU-145]|uniref:esterase/lipase family protein n=1 Tax=Jannaschia halovivens TaxID=3388667 RepID=UPI00396B28EA
MIRLALLLVALALPLRAETVPDCVVLLHGLARSDASLIVMEEALEAEGFQTVNADYPSTTDDIAALAALTLPRAFAACAPDAPAIHVVTHSMGAILLRHWYGTATPIRPGRTVMLAPPNQGSELVDALGGLAPFEWMNGPAGLQLGTDGLAPRLGPVWPGVGVVAGTRSLNPVASAILPGPDDGKVSVASTRVEGMDDHIELPVTHTFLMNSPLVIGEVLAFLRTGRFDRDLGYTDVIETFTD